MAVRISKPHLWPTEGDPVYPFAYMFQANDPKFPSSQKIMPTLQSRPILIASSPCSSKSFKSPKVSKRSGSGAYERPLYPNSGHRAHHVRFGSKADIPHLSGQCPLCAESGHQFGFEDEDSRTLYVIIGRRIINSFAFAVVCRPASLLAYLCRNNPVPICDWTGRRLFVQVTHRLPRSD